MVYFSRPNAGESNNDVECLEKVPISANPGNVSYGCAKSEISGDICDDNPTLLVDGINGQYPALDVIRVVCICMVVVDHGGTSFGHWNTMFVQSWVLQWLFLIAGICYGMTSRGLWHYLSRLGGYFVVGVFCNWMAFVVTGHDVRNDMWNVVFQFWFIVGLMGFLILLTPIKKHLRSVLDSKGVQKPSELALLKDGSDTRGWGFKYHPAQCVIIVLGGFCAISAFAHLVFIPICQIALGGPLLQWVQALGPGAQFWGLPANIDEAHAFIKEFITYFLLSVTSLFLIVVFPMVSERVQYTGWLVLFNIYIHRMFQYRSQIARLINGFDVTMVGMTCFYYGLAHRRVIGEYIVRYWFVFLFMCCLLWPPGTYGRFDEVPTTDSFFRMRYNFLEAMFTVVFLCGMERICDKEIYSKDKAYWIGNWALLLFLVHKAVHIVFPPPYNWSILLSLAPLCWLLMKLQPTKK